MAAQGPPETAQELSQSSGDEFRRSAIKSLRNRFYKEKDVVSDFEMILHARVPIIKFTHTKTGLECDININSPLGIRNSNMLYMYTSIDRRFRDLGFAVKEVAKLGNMNDASIGMLSSYALIIMVVHYLQQLDEPVLPYLQQLSCEKHPKIPVITSGWDSYYFDSIELLSEVWTGKNASSVGELLIGFFRYYTEVFDFEHNVVCVRSPGVLTKEAKRWGDRPICMEDPFDHDHNLSKGVGIRAFRYIEENLRRARIHFCTPRMQHEDAVKDPAAAYRTFFDKEQLSSADPVPGLRCHTCGKQGHRANVCPNQKCFSCGKMGHRKIDCPHKQRRTERLCYGCNQPGHERSNCPNQGQAQHQQRPRFGRGVPSPRRMGRGRQAFG